jgi:hypothetical protein
MNQRKIMCPVSTMLHELERAEDVRRMIRARGRVRARGIESMRGGSWNEGEPEVSVKVGRKCYPIGRGLHSKRSYI